MRATPDFDFGLGEEAAMIRETVARFADEVIAPRAEEIDREDAFPRDLWPAMGELGLHGITVRRGRRRARARLSRARHRDRGSEPRERLGRPQLRRAFEPVHQPDRPLGHAPSRRPSTCPG